MTEFGNASRMLDAYGNEIMFIAETNTWYRWNGVYWESCVNMVIEQYAKQTVLAMGDEAKRLMTMHNVPSSINSVPCLKRRSWSKTW